MEIERQGFIPQIQEKRELFEKRILLCPQQFLIFQETTTKTPIGYLSAEYLKEIPSSGEEINIGHEPKQFSSVPTDSKSRPPLYLYISSYSILPSHRGNGSGKYLWNLAMEYFEKMNHGGQRKIIPLLVVNQAWPAPHHIYKASGFREINIFKDFFPTQNPDKFTDGILMIKD